METRMEEIDRLQLNFNKKFEQVVEPKSVQPVLNGNLLKNLKYALFIAIGTTGIGTGIGLTNGFVEGYKISQEVESKVNLQQAQIDLKEAQRKKVVAEKLALENDKLAYDIWIKNKDDVLNNYEAQLPLYDKLYQSVVKGVKTGLLSVTDLNEVRAQYQEYKKVIHDNINFISSSTHSFEAFHNLDAESRKALDEKLINYQTGSLNRNATLEDLFIAVFSNGDKGNHNLEKLRKDERNKVIDDLADLMNSENPTTTTKKLKR